MFALLLFSSTPPRFISLNPAQDWVAPSAGAGAGQIHPGDTYFEELCVDAGTAPAPETQLQYESLSYMLFVHVLRLYKLRLSSYSV